MTGVDGNKLSSHDVWELLQRVRQRSPRVHAITNTVAQAFTANVLLALGAVPSMTIAPEEVAGFVESADALLVNLGTLDDTRRAAIPRAIAAARGAGKPFVLDPVFVDRSPVRLAYAQTLIEDRPDLLKVNGTELVALCPSSAPCGSLVSGQSALVVTGAEDRIESAGHRYCLLNGDRMLARVTATGCACGAVLAAFSAVEPDRGLAAAAGLSVFNIAGELAAEGAVGPGTLVPRLLDALYRLEAEDIAGRLRQANPSRQQGNLA